jgi:anti-sigma factor RsiW
MNCNTIHEELVDVAAGTAATPEIAAHLRDCSACAETLEHLRQTMAMMDDWTVPEPSPYFDTRLQARLREEKATAPRGIFEWLRRPVLAVAATLLLVAGVALFQGGRDLNTSGTARLQTGETHKVVAQNGTAVGDLRLLDDNSEVLSDFDALDALAGVTADDNNTSVN